MKQEISQAEYTFFESATENGTSPVLTPKELNRVFQVTITGTATVTLSGSIDGTNWTVLRTTTATEAYSTSEPWKYLKSVISGASGATVIHRLGV